jgi:hypothetical protein
VILRAEYVKLENGHIVAHGSLSGLKLRRALRVLREWRRKGYFVKVGW